MPRSSERRSSSRRVRRATPNHRTGRSTDALAAWTDAARLRALPRARPVRGVLPLPRRRGPASDVRRATSPELVTRPGLRVTSCSRSARTRSPSSTASRGGSRACSRTTCGSTTSTACGAGRDRGAARASTTRLARRGHASTIEPELVEARARRGRAGRVEPGRARTRRRQASGRARIEAPYLQLVLQRLWERGARGRLAHAALRDARAARRRDEIVRTHLDARARRSSRPGAGRRRGHLRPPGHAVGDEDRAGLARPRAVRARPTRAEVEPIVRASSTSGS